MSDFRKVEVVTRNAIVDWIQGYRNLLGLNLTPYESMIENAMGRVVEEAREEGEIDWYRVEVNPLTKHSAVVVCYGEYE